MKRFHESCLIFVILAFPCLTHGFGLEGIYCGLENCYDVLGVTRESTKSEIAKQYRRLAKTYHPDMHRDPDEKIEAANKFKEIANAYEILKDEESRNDYDYMLDHPEEVYSHYYRYYRRRVAPKVDARIVIAVTISLISAIQYYTSWKRYESAISYLLTVPKYRNKAVDYAIENGLFNEQKKSKDRTKSKSVKKEEMDAIIRRVLEDNMDIRGGYAKPKISDILWIRIILLPYTIVAYIVWYVSWIWRFDICKNPYGKEEQLYLIKKHMSMGQTQFDALEDDDKEEYLKQELWKKDIYVEWARKKEEDTKKQMAENSRYKAYRRYMKNHGAGRMTFDDS
ncbi:dnaJ homolog subfamily C member 25 homolog [Nilaparvata lugens]|uniref:dnaJ homolog subfamily C member 25 homolog n=1 Tax=Nilaparvata lugens TaxID=108931 RepID=UPI000B98641E|nr:dnaJ homolog subfamily C member 25 homolog [Nilaparvata lugens]